jgi:hypothetical protein
VTRGRLTGFLETHWSMSLVGGSSFAGLNDAALMYSTSSKVLVGKDSPHQSSPKLCLS